jgi:hypothetical protein
MLSVELSSKQSFGRILGLSLKVSSPRRSFELSLVLLCRLLDRDRLPFELEPPLPKSCGDLLLRGGDCDSLLVFSLP